jgi:hypothetical protein
MRRQIGRRTLAVLLSAVTLIASAGIAFADDAPKVASITVVPVGASDIGAGTTSDLDVTIQNLASPQQLGSANITFPNGFVLKSVSEPAGSPTAAASNNAVQLRNLALLPGQSLTVRANAVAPCVAGEYAWTARVKQSNSFSGPPGNDFTIAPEPPSQLHNMVSGTCSVGFSSADFSANPTSAVHDLTITAETLNPVGAPVQVGLLDAGGEIITEPSLQTTVSVTIETNPGGGDLSGDDPVSTSGGFATFGDLSIDKTGLGYTLKATDDEKIADFGVSTEFDIVDSGGICSHGGCSHSASLGGTSSSLFSNSAEDGYYQFLALNVESATSVNCAGYTEVSAVVTFGVSAETGTAQVTLTVQRQGLPVGRRSLNSFQVCYGAPKPFEARGGGLSPEVPAGSGEFVALLPECADTDAPGTPPCVIGRSSTSSTFSITFSTPVGDPKARG